MFQMMALVVKYMDLGLISLFAFMGLYLYLVKPRSSVCRDVYAYQLVIIILFNFLSFLMILLKQWETYRISVLTGQIEKMTMTESAARALEEGSFRGFIRSIFLPGWFNADIFVTSILYIFLMSVMYVVLSTVYRHTNRLLWNCVYMLLSVSFVMLMRLDPEVCRTQVYWMGIGFTVMMVVMLFFKGRWIWKIPAFVFLVLSVGLIALPFAFPYSAYGALNWVRIGPVTFQPSEFVKLTFAFYLAVLYTRKRVTLTLVEAALVTLVLAGVLLVQNDLGALLIFGILAWMMTYDFTGWSFVLWGGALVIGIAGLLAYHYVGHVKVRFDIWLNPWEDIDGNGYQIAQSLFAISGGGWFGLGLYQGMPGVIPVRTSDMIFSVIAEEMGAGFCIMLLLVYLLMFLFVMETGRRERNTFRRNLLIAFGVLFIAQTFIIVGGVIKLIPLTGVTLPFISSGGSSLLSNFITIAIIEAVIRLYRQDREEARRRERAREENAERARAQRNGGKTRRLKKEPLLEPFDFDDPF